ncbi:MAG TPA: prolipoprotein diacylglyceryl transferase [Chroococcales cyanobacterium]|jgi:phosphatidylglycerol:prolipoprotein diacylglycerol transferase
MKAIALQIGPLAIHWYSLMILTAIVIGTSLGRYHARRMGEDPEHIYNIALYGALAGILGARLYYVALSWSYYSSRPLEILATWHGGLAIHGGILGAVTALFFYARKYQLSFWKYLDMLSPSLILGQGIGRWGNFFNNEAYGAPALWPSWWPWHFGNPQFLPWGIHIPSPFRMPEYADLLRFPVDTTLFHPTFLYESLWDVGLFTFLLLLLRRGRQPRGNVFFFYLMLYSTGRFFIEGLRTDPLMLFGVIRMAQFVSLTLIAVGLGTILFRTFQKRAASPNLPS